ncbi:MAG: hotdog fold thioesterase [Bacteroidota bacterium]|nr:hotdog fold thioesterase [Bacteroidota bacterium]MDP3145200.1 hotdog fold thioesterase [Bacteroidota bacterium]
MSIWNGDITTELLNNLNKNTLGEFFEINFTEVGADYLKATMPVVSKTKQPFGLLHGGASVALAETIGSVASWCIINRELFIGVGIEINANHLSSVTEGFVTAICSPIKVKGKLHIWEIKIYNPQQELCCISRFTCMIVAKK